MQIATTPQPTLSLWRTVSRFETDKLAPGLALRNTLGLVIPLALGVATGFIGTGLVAASGALNVSFSDGDDPYKHRARRMLSACLLVAVAVFVGAVSGRDRSLVALVAVAWAFGAGIAVALGTGAADLGVVSLVTLIVFSAQPMSLTRATNAGLVALAGGLFQTLLSLALWPVRRYQPERRALAQLYQELARTVAQPAKASEAPPATAESTRAQEALAALSRDHSVESERYLLLLSQAERMRLNLLALSRMRQRLEREEGASVYSGLLERCFQLGGKLLESIGNCLMPGGCASPSTEDMHQLQSLAEELRQPDQKCASSSVEALVHDARFQLDALAGQLRSALELAAHATPQGEADFASREARQPWMLRLGGRLATVRANLALPSAAFRHAVRLAACIGASEILGGILGWQRSYWMPMTIAIVLKPDFTSTFSRGVLRLAGTFVGLLLTTALFHFHPPGLALDVALIALMFYALRCFGPANYGVFVAAVSALVVLLIAITGVDPKQVIAARAWNTGAGGALALIAYAGWPTWERNQVSEALANLLDAYFGYFQAVADAYMRTDTSFAAELDRARLSARLARSNAMTSVDRVSGEPGASTERVSMLAAMLANSHRFVHALMTLEAGLAISRRSPARDEFRRFTWDVELTLHSLAAALRGSPLSSGDLPDLREDHRALTRSGDSRNERYAIVNVETDRITNSLNTLKEQILQWSVDGFNR